MIAANSGFAISNVLVDGVSQGAIASFNFTNVTAAHTISATFAAVNFTITATAVAGGASTPPGPAVLPSGRVPGLTHTPHSRFPIQDSLPDRGSPVAGGNIP